MNILRQIAFAFVGTFAGLIGMVITRFIWSLQIYDLATTLVISWDVLKYLPLSMVLVLLGARCFRHQAFVKHLGSIPQLYLNGFLVLCITGAGFFIPPGPVESLQAIVCYRLALAIYFNLNLRRLLRLLRK